MIIAWSFAAQNAKLMTIPRSFSNIHIILGLTIGCNRRPAYERRASRCASSVQDTRARTFYARAIIKDAHCQATLQSVITAHPNIPMLGWVDAETRSSILELV